MEKYHSPIVRVPPPLTAIATAQTGRRVTFDISDSDDPLALHATPREKPLGMQALDIAATSQHDSRPVGRPRGSMRRKTLPAFKSSSLEPAGFVYQYKDHRRNSDYNNHASLQSQAQAPGSDSQDAEATLHPAEPAVTSIVEAETGMAADGTSVLSKRAKTTAVAKKENKRPAGRPKGSARRKTLPAPKSSLQSRNSQDAEDTIVLAKPAATTLADAAADRATPGPRRSGRVPKPRDLGNLKGNGEKTKRARDS
jgi:hypothetical protein